MTRKDSEKDADRPHYYSQFWLDIAAGRRVIGGAKPEESAAGEGEAPEAPPSRKAGRGNTDGYRAPARAAAESSAEEEGFESEETVEQPDIDFGEEIGPEDEVIEDEAIEEEFAAEDALIEDEAIEEEFASEEEDFFDEEEEEEEEWGRHGRKKPKPVRPVKQPVKKVRRDPRRSF